MLKRRDRSFDPLLAYVFSGSRGGPTRIRIVQLLLEKPTNPNVLATTLGLDYKTIEYNLRVLTKHVFVVCDQPDSYGAPYRPSKNLLALLPQFERLAQAVATPATAPNVEKVPNTTQAGDVMK